MILHNQPAQLDIQEDQSGEWVEVQRRRKEFGLRPGADRQKEYDDDQLPFRYITRHIVLIPQLTGTLRVLVQKVGPLVQGLVDLGDDTADRCVDVRRSLDGLDSSDRVWR